MSGRSPQPAGAAAPGEPGERPVVSPRGSPDDLFRVIRVRSGFLPSLGLSGAGHRRVRFDAGRWIGSGVLAREALPVCPVWTEGEWCQGRNRVSCLRHSKVAYFWAYRPSPYQQTYHHDVLMCGLDSVRAAWFWIQVAVAEHNLPRLESRFEKVLRGIASSVASACR